MGETRVPNLKEKEQTVDELAALLERSQLTILAEYRGLTVAEMSALRTRLRESGSEFHVAKNTMTRRAATRLGREALVPHLVGPLGLAFGFSDPAGLAKAVNDYARQTRGVFAPKAALLGDRVVGAAEITRLADLPSREQLIAQVVGGMQAPIVGLVSVLNGTLRGLVGVLEARRQQLEGEAA